MHQVKNSADLGAKCIVGTVYDKEMQEDEVKVTLIATGFDIENEEYKRIKDELALPNKEENLNNIRIEKESWFNRFIKKWF